MSHFLIPIALPETASAKNDLLPVLQTHSVERMGGTLRSPILLAQQSNLASN